MGNIFIGDSSSKARKVKNLFIGDSDGKARQVKNIYIGVNGVARLVWSAIKSFTKALSVHFDSNTYNIISGSSHDFPYVNNVKVNKIVNKDNEFFASGEITTRNANESSYTFSFSRMFKVDDDGNIVSEVPSVPIDAYYFDVDKNYYFVNCRQISPYMGGEAYSLCKAISLSSYDSHKYITVLDKSNYYYRYYLVNFCKVDNNAFVGCFSESYNSTNRCVMFLIKADGTVKEIYITSGQYKSKMYYVSDKKLTCIIDKTIYFITFDQNYSTTIKSATLGDLTYEGKSYPLILSTQSLLRSMNTYAFFGNTFFAMLEEDMSNSANDNRIFIPIKLNFDTATFSIGTGTKVINCGDAVLDDNLFIEDNTIVLFTEKGYQAGTYSHWYIMLPYNANSNSFGEYTISNTLADGSAIVSGSLYDTYHGFAPIKTGIKPLKLVLFDTIVSRTSTTNTNAYSINYRTGSITIN